jgi:hypothetical protein
VYQPIAVQAVDDAHDTPVSASGAYALVCGLGVGWLAQLRPFQRSANAVQPDPTAVHAVVDGHETPISSPVGTPTGSVADWIVQAVPFQRSTSGVSPIVSPGTLVPTAMQALRDGHATPLKLLPGPTAGWGVGGIDQRLPSHRSVSGSGPPATVTDPTALQAFAEAQDTLLSWPPVDRAGSTVGWIDQALPSQRSLSGLAAPATVYAPTAVQASGDVQDTPARRVLVEPAGSVVGWIDQRLPSHRSASGDVRPAAAYQPTAVQAVDDAHETAVRVLDVAPGAVGVVSIDQVLPSKRSASVTGGLVLRSAPRVSELPTAAHESNETHVTAVSRTSNASAGLTGRSILQLLPSQRSSSDQVGWPRLQSTHPV